ncbi:MAG: homoserine dehydrogenase [Candidatus Saganbacteria bacterium]|nr:homoserine dehydrogenase [Candidatus Saganbacteria bacterium]
MQKEIKIGLIGFGTVGSGVAALLQKNALYIEKMTGVSIRIDRIADTDILRKRPVDIDMRIMTQDAYDIIKDKKIDIAVEAVGGTDPALRFVIDAINEGKHIVTSNKELMAKHGPAILEAADNKGVRVLFEGSVGGGIPIIAGLRRLLSANRIEEVYGIVNGTTNYILSDMAASGRDFSASLEAAKRLGYAESDPKNDIEGFDASFKAAILASVAFGQKVNWEKIYFEGIDGVTVEDVQYAEEMGYSIKLLAVAKRKNGGCEIRVNPVLIDKDHPLAGVSGAYNAIYVKGDSVGEQMFYGEGAGGGPTASAVVSDVIEIALNPDKGNIKLEGEAKIANIDDCESRFYVRLRAKDAPGVLAAIAGAFGDKKVSIQSALQKGTIDNIATIVIITHKVKERNFREAAETISRLPQIDTIGSIIRAGME